MQRGKKKTKKKLLPGGKLDALNQYSVPAAQGLELAGTTIEQNSAKPSIAGGALKGAGKGAAAGAAFGPYGAIIGAGVGAIAGGVTSGIQRKKFEEQAALDEAADNAQADRSAIMNAGNYKHGGKLLAKSLNTIKGGRLNAISDDAVEVKANNPSETDSVELDSAYVDNNEVIDNQSRVFSDSIKLRNGRTVAKEAKRLEKQKKEDYETRFADSNSRLDEKLDTLFNYQESMKKPKSKNKLANGGLVGPGPKIKKEGSNPYYTLTGNQSSSEARKYLDQELNKYHPGIPLEVLDRQNIQVVPGVMDTPAMNAIRRGVKPSFTISGDQLKPPYNINKQNIPAKNNLTKPKFDDGGDLLSLLKGYKRSPNVKQATLSPTFANYNVKASAAKAAQQKYPTPETNFDWNNLATQVATYGPNVANAILQKRLKGPAAPQLEDRATLDRVSPDANLAANNNDFLNTNRVIQNNTGQASNLTAATGSLLARKFAANNQIYGQNQALNAQINNQEVGMNTAIRARNTERTNEFRADKVNFNNQKQTLTSQNITNAATKFLQQGREKNEMSLDREKYQIMMGQYNDLPEEMKAKYASLFANRGLKPSNKKGGKIKPNKKKVIF